MSCGREPRIAVLADPKLSNKEIARTLTIAPETVKSHVKHIFTKLNVEKRAQAVSCAQILAFCKIELGESQAGRSRSLSHRRLGAGPLSVMPSLCAYFVRVASQPPCHCEGQ